MKDTETIELENQRLKAHLERLTAEAEHNEFLLRQAQARQYELLTADSLPTLLRSLLHGIRDEYKLKAVTLVYDDVEQNMPELLLRHHTTLDDYPGFQVVEGIENFSPLIRRLTTPQLGEYSREHKPFFFAGRAGIMSVAILPLVRHGKLMGTLNFASDDPTRFTPALGTDILEQLALIVAFCLENVINRERLVLTGLTDALTGWPNRRYLEHRLQEELARVQRNQGSVSCILFDIDHFKKVNDEHGHQAGDQVLQQLAKRLRKTLRHGDVAARYGGEEFIIILPQVEKDFAVEFAERMRHMIAEAPFQVTNNEGAELEIPVTISLGVSEQEPKWDSNSMTYLAGELIAAADTQLYHAKSKGRNQVSY